MIIERYPSIAHVPTYRHELRILTSDYPRPQRLRYLLEIFSTLPFYPQAVIMNYTVITYRTPSVAVPFHFDVVPVPGSYFFVGVPVLAANSVPTLILSYLLFKMTTVYHLKRQNSGKV